MSAATSWNGRRSSPLSSRRQFALLGETVIGATVATELGLAPGDDLLSSPETLFDLAGGSGRQIADAGGNTVLVYGVLQPASLTATTWQLTGYNNGKGGVVSVIIGTSITANFTEDGQINGNSGCNDYFGQYITDLDLIKIGPLASTRKLCANEEINTQEQLYLQAMEQAETYRMVTDKLELRTKDGAMMAHFVRK